MSHSCQTFSCENGAFRLPNGVMPESAPHRRREYASCVEGCLWCIEKKRSSRNEADIFAELGRLFRAITSHVRVGGGSDANHSSDDVAGDPRGKKRRRPWLTMEESEIQPSSDMLSDLNIFEALMYLSLDKWGSEQRFGGSQSKTLAAQEAVNCQAMWRKLSPKIESGDIIPFTRNIWTAKR